ncbi:MAG TPA: molybdenum cofactor guanylyltransferase [Candidatus Limnocylindrales bacterium]|nr:molybdenum cofactor guanylyltransferase [Candidatus Limnocylindrales bacterium]
MTERVAAVVLAGGRSSRFGRDKLAEPIDGRPMLDHVIDRVRAVTPEIVVVAATRSMPDIASDVDLVHDERPFEGPLAGLAVGLRAVDPGIERVIVVGGDMPTVVPAVLDRLLSSLERRQAAVLADEERARALPLALRRSAAAEAAEHLLEHGERRLRALLERLDVEVLAPERWREDDADGETLRDVDVPDDLQG